jgi:hypothetical protein
MPSASRCFPGRLTLEEWLVARFRWRLIQRTQADLLGSFRYCVNKRCRRVRACCNDRPDDLPRPAAASQKGDDQKAVEGMGPVRLPR